MVILGVSSLIGWRPVPKILIQLHLPLAVALSLTLRGLLPVGWYRQFVFFSAASQQHFPPLTPPFCATLKMRKLVYFVFLLGLPDMMETVMTNAIYNSVNTPVKGALRCAVQRSEIQDRDVKNGFFAVDAAGNCVLNQTSGSQYERTALVSGINKHFISLVVGMFLDHINSFFIQYI